MQVSILVDDDTLIILGQQLYRDCGACFPLEYGTIIDFIENVAENPRFQSWDEGGSRLFCFKDIAVKKNIEEHQLRYRKRSDVKKIAAGI